MYALSYKLIKTQNPLDRSKIVDARVLPFKFQKPPEPIDCELEDGRTVRVTLAISAISEPMNKDGTPLIDPATGQPFFTLNYNVSITTLYSDKTKSSQSEMR